jgi:hypothetical protein
LNLDGVCEGNLAALVVQQRMKLHVGDARCALQAQENVSGTAREKHAPDFPSRIEESILVNEKLADSSAGLNLDWSAFVFSILDDEPVR